MSEKYKGHDELFKIFQAAKTDTLNSYLQTNALNFDKEMTDQYENKLENYIDEKEKIIIEVNKKKSIEQFKLLGISPNVELLKVKSKQYGADSEALVSNAIVKSLPKYFIDQIKIENQ